jgi:sensor histidine kinase regulating citrate/malate metabolism
MLIYCSISFVVTILILLLLYFGYYKKGRYYVLGIKSRVFFVVWLFVFYIFPSIPVYGTDDAMKYRLLCYIFGVLIPLVGVIAPSLLIMTAAEKSLKEKNEYQENYLNAELEYIEQYKRSQTETRAFRHDIINNLSLTSMMLDEGRTEEAGEHLKSLLGNVRALSPSIITGDEMLDCIVAMKADKMKEMGIAFTTDGVVDGGLHMKPMDVCSIFANALDNAIEACSHLLPEAKENGSGEEAPAEETASVNQPHVDMKIKRTEKFFVINIANSAKGKVDIEKLMSSSGYTSKKDTEHHGFGLRNIRRSVEEYDGILKAESKDDEFSLAIMIPR